MTRQVLFAGLTAAIALLSLLAGSGIGQAYNLYPITSAVVMGAYFLFPAGRTLSTGYVRRREFFLALGLTLVFLVWPATQNNFEQALKYIWLLMLPYVIGQFSLSRRDVQAMSLGALMVGFAVVGSNVFLNIFSNWNRNDIAMVGFMGCAVFCCAPWETWGMKIFQKLVLVAMTLLVLRLDSRSCVVGCLVLCVFAFRLINPYVLLKKKWLRRLVLVLPAIIAVGVVLFQNSSMFDSLNELSMEYFGKPIFNGRNEIWQQGINKLMERPWLGKGKIDNGHWHNCAITALTAFGTLGYALWVCYFENIMVDCQRWRDDKCLGLCIAAFLTIMFQQSFELGLISTTGSMMPYLIMGIMLGRMRHLRQK